MNKKFSKMSYWSTIRMGILTVIISMVVLVNQSNAQNIIGAFNPTKGNLTLATSYTYERFGEYYKGSEKTVLGVKDITIHSVGLYGEYGISDRLAVIVNLPFVNTSSSNTNVNPSNNLQDMAFHVKYALINPSDSRFLLTSALGVSFPVSDYDPLVPTAIGSHAVCTHISLAGLYKLGKGVFLESAASYIGKNEHVPDAFQGTVKVGWSKGKFYGHTFYTKQESFSGDNLGDQGSNFQSLKVSYDRLGVYASYRFIPKVSTFIGWGGVINGLNVGQSTSVNLGIVGNFSL